MGNLVAKMVGLNAKKFNKLRDKLLPAGITATLLTKDGFTVNYQDPFAVTNWYYTNNSFTKETTVTVARLDSQFAAAFLVASDIAIGTEVYEIDKRDSRAPDGNKPYWSIICNRTENTYTPV